MLFDPSIHLLAETEFPASTVYHKTISLRSNATWGCTDNTPLRRSGCALVATFSAKHTSEPAFQDWLAPEQYILPSSRGLWHLGLTGSKAVSAGASPAQAPVGPRLVPGFELLRRQFLHSNAFSLSALNERPLDRT